jgi:hypothetical protein
MLNKLGCTASPGRVEREQFHFRQNRLTSRRILQVAPFSDIYFIHLPPSFAACGAA